MSDIFFERTETIAFLEDLGEPSDWVVYVGLGATIDRTGASWAVLVDRLLSHFEPDPEVRDVVINKFGEVRTATIIESLFEKEYPASERLEALQGALRAALYGRQRELSGEILPALAQMAYTIAGKGYSAVFLTPNYDHYLYKALKNTGKRIGQRSQLQINHVLTDSAPSWKDEWSKPGSIACVHLHGFVGSTEGRGVPVLGEMSYAATAERTSSAITAAIRGRNLLIVGSSLTDAPLVTSLIRDNAYYSNSKRSATKPARIVVQPLQSSELSAATDSEQMRLLRWNTRRFSAMGVSVIYPDFYFQIGQLISELQRRFRFGDAAELQKPRYWRRYHERLDLWWQQWSTPNLETPAAQGTMSDALSDLLVDIRRAASIPAGEGLKLELWVRWNPQRDSRELALWASSVGTWPDVLTMRRDKIGTRSPYRSVEIFCGGAPKFLVANGETGSSQVRERWRSYLGVPIWVEGIDGTLPVGLVSLASMYEAAPSHASEPSSSVSMRNIENIYLAIGIMRKFGKLALMTPSTTLTGFVLDADRGPVG